MVSKTNLTRQSRYNGETYDGIASSVVLTPPLAMTAIIYMLLLSYGNWWYARLFYKNTGV